MVTVVDYRYAGHNAATLCDAVLAALRQASGRPWPLATYVVANEKPPWRGDHVELKAVLDAHQLWRTRHALLFAPGDFGSFEQYWLTPGRLHLWGDVSTENIALDTVPAPLVVHALNVERGVAEALHSVAHTAERMLGELPGGLLTGYVGYDPWPVYAGAPAPSVVDGHGCVHWPPAVTGAPYQYATAGGQESFLRGWLAGLPGAVWDTMQVG